MLVVVFGQVTVNTEHKAPEKCAIFIPTAIKTAHSF